MEIKANFINCKSVGVKSKTLYLCTCISKDLGCFNFFVSDPIKCDYLKPLTLEFDIMCYNQRLGLKFLNLK